MVEAFIGTIMPWPCNFAPKGWAFCYGQIIAVNDNLPLFSLLGTMYGGDGSTTFALPDLRGRAVIGEGQGVNLTPRVLSRREGTETIYPETILASHTHTIPTSGMSVNLSSATLEIEASEITINSSGTYGVPITSESNDPESMPTDLEHYLGTPKLNNGLPLNAYYKSNDDPTVTTKPTTISVSGKATPIINASLSGGASVSVQSGLTVSKEGRAIYPVPIMQPSLVLNYIICLQGIFPTRS